MRRLSFARLAALDALPLNVSLLGKSRWWRGVRTPERAAPCKNVGERKWAGLGNGNAVGPEHIEAWLRTIDRAALTPIARQALRSATADVTEWRWEPLRASLGSSLGLATGGLYRVSGLAQERHSTPAEWAAVLKVVRPPRGTRHDADARDPGHWAYWNREPLAYASGLLDDLPGGLTAPRCLGMSEETGAPGRPGAPGEVVWLWLEAIADDYGEGWSAWPAPRHLLAARHLGAFNGTYLGQRPLPSCPWLGREYLRQRIEQTDAAGGLPLFDDPTTWRHDLLRGAFDADTGERLSRLWAERHRLLDALDRLPQTLRHGDAHRSNLFARRVHTGDEVTTAIDWGTMGIGPVGAELVEVALGRFVATELLATEETGGTGGTGGTEIAERLFESYVDGLRAAGWTGDAKLPRFGFAATTALTGASRLHWTLAGVLDDRRRADFLRAGATDAAGLLRRQAAVARYFLGLGDEATRSLPLV